MDEQKIDKKDHNWHRVYVAVIITTFAVILALFAFSKYFSM